MKHLLFATLVVCVAPFAKGAITDITVFDGLLGDSFGNSGHDPRLAGEYGEYKEVEVGNVATDMWDLRALGYDYSNQTLYYQGGYNPLMVTNPSQGTFGVATIFIETTNVSTGTPKGTPDHTNGFETQSNANFGYDYAVTLSISGSGLNYSIWQLTSSSVLTSVYFGANEDAGPYAFVPSTENRFTWAGGQTQKWAQVLNVNSTTFDANYGDLQSFGQSNYVTSFDLSPIAAQLRNGAAFYLAEACGNDLIVGQINAVPQSLSTIPEPGSMLGLAGLLLGGACFRSRRPARS